MKYRFIVLAALLLVPLSASAQVVIPGGLSTGNFRIGGFLGPGTSGGGGGPSYPANAIVNDSTGNFVFNDSTGNVVTNQ